MVTFLWWWVWPVVVAIALAVGGIAWRRAARRRAPRDVVWVANSAYIDDVPAVMALMRRYRLLQATLGVALLAAIVAAGAMAARPARTQAVSEEMRTRDIVLCLDTSGSMTAFDGKIFEIFSRLVKQFEGERIALSIFNSTSRTVFPLTDDYALVQDQFAEGIAALDKDPNLLEPASPRDAQDIKEYLQFTAGTVTSQEGASLVGDGLANCAGLFDNAGADRSRSIILATDNFVSGTPIYSLNDAATLSDSMAITLDGIWANTDPGGYLGYDEGSGKGEFANVVATHGGMFFTADDPGVVESIVDQVVAEQAHTLDADVHTRVVDTPRLWFCIAFVAVACLCVVAWRVRE